MAFLYTKQTPSSNRLHHCAPRRGAPSQGFVRVRSSNTTTSVQGGRWPSCALQQGNFNAVGLSSAEANQACNSDPNATRCWSLNKGCHMLFEHQFRWKFSTQVGVLVFARRRRRDRLPRSWLPMTSLLPKVGPLVVAWLCGAEPSTKLLPRSRSEHPRANRQDGYERNDLIWFQRNRP